MAEKRARTASENFRSILRRESAEDDYTPYPSRGSWTTNEYLSSNEEDDLSDNSRLIFMRRTKTSSTTWNVTPVLKSTWMRVRNKIFSLIVYVFICFISSDESTTPTMQKLKLTTLMTRT